MPIRNGRQAVRRHPADLRRPRIGDPHRRHRPGCHLDRFFGLHIRFGHHRHGAGFDTDIAKAGIARLGVDKTHQAAAMGQHAGEQGMGIGAEGSGIARLLQGRQIGRLGLEGVIAGFAMLAAAAHEERLQCGIRGLQLAAIGHHEAVIGSCLMALQSGDHQLLLHHRRLEGGCITGRGAAGGQGRVGQSQERDGRGSGFPHGVFPFSWTRCACVRSARPEVRNDPDAPPLRPRRRHRRSSGNCGWRPCP